MLNQGSGTPGAADVDSMEESKDDSEDKENEEEKKDDEEGDTEEEKRRAEGAEEPPAFGVEGDGGDSSVLEAAKEEVNFTPRGLWLVVTREGLPSCCTAAALA